MTMKTVSLIGSRVAAKGVMLSLASLLITGALVGCATQEEPEPAPAPEPEAVAPEPELAPEPEPEPEPEQPKLAIPNHYFLSGVNFKSGGSMGAGEAAYDPALADLEGNIAAYENPDMRSMGGFSEGRVCVSWETSEYDEEWDTEFDEVTHYGLLDETGKLVLDLTDLVHSFDFTSKAGNSETKEIFSVGNSPMYVDGRLVLDLGSIIVVLNEKGETVFTVGDPTQYEYAEEGYVPPKFDIEMPLRAHDGVYRDGVMLLNGASVYDDMVIVDADGNILAQGEYLNSLGKGYMTDGDEPTAVTDYSGKVLFDPSSLNVPGDVENARLDLVTVLGIDGLVVVKADKINPHGGADKELTGLYCVSTQKWVVPMQEGSLNITSAHDGIAWVTADSKNFIVEGYGAEDDDVNEKYTCAMNTQGEIVLDAETPAVADCYLRPSFDAPTYLGEGYWTFDSQRETVLYFKDGVLVGSAKPPENGIAYSLYSGN